MGSSNSFTGKSPSPSFQCNFCESKISCYCKSTSTRVDVPTAAWHVFQVQQREKEPLQLCFFPPAATVIPCFHCLDSSFVGLVLLVWLCSHCLVHKLAEKPEPDKHAAHTSVQICGIFPRCKQLTASNEHMLLLLQLCHHNYWPKSVPSHWPHHSPPPRKTNQVTVSKVRKAGTFGGEAFKLN